MRNFAVLSDDVACILAADVKGEHVWWRGLAI